MVMHHSGGCVDEDDYDYNHSHNAMDKYGSMVITFKGKLSC